VHHPAEGQIRPGVSEVGTARVCTWTSEGLNGPANDNWLSRPSCGPTYTPLTRTPGRRSWRNELRVWAANPNSCNALCSSVNVRMVSVAAPGTPLYTMAQCLAGSTWQPAHRQASSQPISDDVDHQRWAPALVQGLQQLTHLLLCVPRSSAQSTRPAPEAAGSPPRPSRRRSAHPPPVSVQGVPTSHEWSNNDRLCSTGASSESGRVGWTLSLSGELQTQGRALHPPPRSY